VYKEQGELKPGRRRFPLKGPNAPASDTPSFHFRFLRIPQSIWLVLREMSASTLSGVTTSLKLLLVAADRT